MRDACRSNGGRNKLPKSAASLSARLDCQPVIEWDVGRCPARLAHPFHSAGGQAALLAASSCQTTVHRAPELSASADAPSATSFSWWIPNSARASAALLLCTSLQPAKGWKYKHDARGYGKRPA